MNGRAAFDPDHVRAIAELMVELELDEYSSEHFCLKKSRHKLKAPVALTLDSLAEHLKPSETAPWDSVPQEVADQWAEKGQP